MASTRLKLAPRERNNYDPRDGCSRTSGRKVAKASQFHLGSSDPPHAASDTRCGERIVRTETTYWLVDAVGIVQMVTTAPQCGAAYTETSRLLHYHVGQSS